MLASLERFFNVERRVSWKVVRPPSSIEAEERDEPGRDEREKVFFIGNMVKTSHSGLLEFYGFFSFSKKLRF
jgi:hypothetical protein